MSLIDQVTAAVQRAGAQISAGDPPENFDQLRTALDTNDTLVRNVLKPALLDLLPGSVWDDDEHGSGPVPAGDRWYVDPVGGNINPIHGMSDWNVGVSLVRDGRPELAVLHAPVLDEMYTASAGGGAFLNGHPIHASRKTDLAVARVSTGQAMPTDDPTYPDLIGNSVAAMLRNALTVGVSLPATYQVALVAAGRMDAHWQFHNVRAHIGPLLIAKEAGVLVTDLEGKPWEITSDGYLAAAPGLHDAALDVLNGRH
ncbi:inositol phosphatase [Virgisporangium aliadipatigenens]|uniref:Inositol phosphatase n=1 Tax=Virgisporangium aliadipatigenens TaxID=741659 RepID=A0A8J3YN18_9ACTN|nr:inositol monophosphatase family protein [Virgisporangium aliadipatigenens]GIJ46718.1 inositol phosphatase [Virgisporangium aliadipatigenens]